MQPHEWPVDATSASRVHRGARASSVRSASARADASRTVRGPKRHALDSESLDAATERRRNRPSRKASGTPSSIHVIASSASGSDASGEVVRAEATIRDGEGGRRRRHDSAQRRRRPVTGARLARRRRRNDEARATGGPWSRSVPTSLPPGGEHVPGEGRDVNSGARRRTRGAPATSRISAGRPATTKQRATVRALRIRDRAP